MSSAAASVEELLGTNMMDDNIQQLLALNDTLSNANVSAPLSGGDASLLVLQDVDAADLDFDKQELDQYLSGPHISHDIHENIDDQLASSSASQWTHHAAYANAKATGPTTSVDHVPLSGSVQVKKPPTPRHSSRKIELVKELEETYRARYKSDYFPQNGKARFPRYVADREGKSAVTLKVMPGLQGFIRVDWTTIEKAPDIRYSMPYKFQVHNSSNAVEDRNPRYFEIQTDAEGIMELTLVLIKTKQSELKPLQPFPPIEQPSDTANGPRVTLDPSMPPKQMIERHQLDRSQLAFTFCPSDADGKPGLPEWKTTVYSTVMTGTTSRYWKEKANHLSEVFAFIRNTVGKNRRHRP